MLGLKISQVNEAGGFAQILFPSEPPGYPLFLSNFDDLFPGQGEGGNPSTGPLTFLCNNRSDFQGGF